MSQSQTFNNTVYSIPVRGDLNWGPALTRYLAALGTYAISPAGGLYTLTADLNLGASFGVVAAYFKTSTANLATAGFLRLAHSDALEWRNNANSGNLALSVDSSDRLNFNGTPVQPLVALTDGQFFIGSSGNLPVGQTLSGAITCTDAGVTSISSGYITNTMVNNSAAIAYSKLSLTGSILNADIYSAAAIAFSKMATLNNSIVPVTSGSGVITSSSTTATELGYLSGVTSALQTQINAKQATGNYITALTGDITASGPGSVASTLATVNANVGSFTLASITVNAKGLITAASNGSAGTGTVTSVSGTANQIAVATGTTTPVISLTSPVTFPGAMTAGGALAMASNKITGLANGTASTDAAAFGQLKIIQYITATTSTAATSTSATYADTNLTASITPTSSSSKVLVLVAQQMDGATTGAQSVSTGGLQLLRGASILVTNANACGANFAANTGETVYTVSNLFWLDSPATTSATTYKTQFNRLSGADGTVHVQTGSTNTSTIILIEVA